MTLARFFVTGLFSVMFALAGLEARAASPRISGVTPLGVVPGAKTILTFSGSNLAKATNLWTSFGAAARPRRNSSGDGVSFEVECSEEASGIGAVQVYGPDGASDFHLIFLDPFPAEKPASGNHSSAAARRIDFPAAVDSVLKSEQIDYYRFSGKAGEAWSIEVLAHRIGSQADPVARILDAAGREVAYGDDEDGVWRDARLRFRVPADGEYTLLVHDVGYGGGGPYFYRLRAGSFPIIGPSFPLQDPSEAGTFIGNNGETGPASPANPTSAAWLSARPMVVEREPNETEAVAHEFAIPAILNGRFQSAEDRDLFRFEVTKEQKIRFQGQTRALGSPCDLALRIWKSGGADLARSEGGREALTNTFTAGTYYLEARELTGAAPRNAPYRIIARAAIPGFSLSADTNHFDLAPGTSAPIKVICERYDYDGKIDLEILGEDRLEATGTIPEKKKDGELTIRLNENTPPGTLLHFALQGKGTNNTAAAISTKPALRKSFSLMLNPPSSLDGLFSVSTIGK